MAMKKTHILYTCLVIGGFLAGVFFGNSYTSARWHKEMKGAQTSPEQIFYAKVTEGAPPERVLLEQLLENKKESIAILQMVFTTAFPKQKELMVFTGAALPQSKKELQMLEGWLTEWYGIQEQTRDEALPVEVSAPR